MIHLIFCLRRLPALTREQFQTYWRDQHAPLVQTHASTLGIRRYVQAHTLDPTASRALAESRAAPVEFDGVAEIWLDEDYLAGDAATAEMIAAGRALLDDERKFIDLANSPIFLTRDHVIIG